MEFPSNVLKNDPPSYDEVVKDTMEYARKNDLTDGQAAKMLERMLRRYGMEPKRTMYAKDTDKKNMRYGGKACRGRKAAGSAEKAR